MIDNALMHTIGKADGKEVIWYALHGYIVITGNSTRIYGAKSIKDAVILAEDNIPNFNRRRKLAWITR